MSEKTEKINSWLGAVFGEDSVPRFEINTRTVDILYQLMQGSEARCRDTTLLIEDYKQKATEYQTEGNHLQDILQQSMDLSPAGLSGPATRYLSALVESALVLGVRDTSLSSYLPAVNNLTSELLEAEKSNRSVERELKVMKKKIEATMVQRVNLQADLKKTIKLQAEEKVKTDQRLLNMDFVRGKTKELSIRQKESEAQLASLNMDDSLTHEAIVKLSEEVTALQGEMIPLKQKLESYMDLSPNPSLAQVKIEEGKRKLAALDLQFNADLNK